MKGVEIEKSDKSENLSENPFCKGLNVNVQVPESIEIRMVEASALGDYELGILVSSLIFSFASGFLVAYFQEPVKTHLLTSGIIFSVLFAIFIKYSLIKRANLTKMTKTIKLKAHESEED